MPKLVNPKVTGGGVVTPPVIGQPTSMSTATVDNRTSPVRTLLATLEGTPWRVDMYLHQVGKHNDLQQIDPSQAAALRPITLLRDMVVYVDRGLEDNTDPATGVTTVTGSANVPPGVTPNVNDYLVAESTVGRKAVYRITSVVRKSFSKDTVYQIEYQLVEYYNPASDITAKLLESTSQTYVYDAERSRVGQQPILQADSADRIKRMRDWVSHMVRDYMRTHYSPRTRSIAVLGQGDAGVEEVLDVFVLWYLDRIVDPTTWQGGLAYNAVPIQSEYMNMSNHLWSVLHERDHRRLKRVSRDLGIVSSLTLSVKTTALRQLAYSGARNVVVDKSIVDDEANRLWVREGADISLRKHTVAGVSVPWVHPTHLDAYVLSEAFYTGNKAGMSVLELQTTDYLNHVVMDGAVLESLIEEYEDQWYSLERFYYGPVLLTLVINFMREVSL